jgi:large subunit ribosomal protein L1
MATKTAKKKIDSKRFSAASEKIEKTRFYTVDEAIKLLKETASTKFDESIDLAIRLGVDPRQGDQNVRGTTSLPHGTGKKKTVAVLASGDAAKEAEAAGADVVGDEDLIKKIQDGWKDFDVMVASSDMAKSIGKIGRFLGPKTPNKRNGTVTDNIGDTVKEIKSAARIEYRIEKAGICHLSIGKVSFTEDQIKENFTAALDAVIRAKPAASKGRYLRTVTISSTMGPGIKLDPSDVNKAAGH